MFGRKELIRAPPRCPPSLGVWRQATLLLFFPPGNFLWIEIIPSSSNLVAVTASKSNFSHKNLKLFILLSLSQLAPTQQCLHHQQIVAILTS
jgi:hypothetical protein